MKKIFMSLALVATIGIGFVSCAGGQEINPEDKEKLEAQKEEAKKQAEEQAAAEAEANKVKAEVLAVVAPVEGVEFTSDNVTVNGDEATVKYTVGEGDAAKETVLNFKKGEDGKWAPVVEAPAAKK